MANRAAYVSNYLSTFWTENRHNLIVNVLGKTCYSRKIEICSSFLALFRFWPLIFYLKIANIIKNFNPNLEESSNWISRLNESSLKSSYKTTRAAPLLTNAQNVSQIPPSLSHFIQGLFSVSTRGSNFRILHPHFPIHSYKMCKDAVAYVLTDFFNNQQSNLSASCSNTILYFKHHIWTHVKTWITAKNINRWNKQGGKSKKRLIVQIVLHYFL